MSEQKHTPGLLKVSGCCMVYQNYAKEWIHEPIISMADDFASSPGICVVNCKEYRKTEKEARQADPEAMANAERLVLAWNSHDDLLKIIEGAIQTAEDEHATDAWWYAEARAAIATVAALATPAERIEL